MRDFLKGVWLPTSAAAICAGCALKEWTYWRDHPHGRGPSGVIAALATAGLLIALHVAANAWEKEMESQRFWREQTRKAREERHET